MKILNGMSSLQPKLYPQGVKSMLIYVIPLVIVVIALVFLKKRQSAQESDKANAQRLRQKKQVHPLKNGPKSYTSCRSGSKPTTTALNDDTRKKIQSLIDERNLLFS